MRNINTLLSSLALAIAASAGTAVAHPFAFDIAKMVGFKVLTAEDDAMSADDMVVVRYDGPIAFPMAANLREIWSEIARTPRFKTIVFQLNSPGGTQNEGEAVMQILGEIRDRADLVTLVSEHDLCASMCIPLFIQGETRFASPASAWMFHGASLYMSNIPCLSMTMRYVDYFKHRDVGTTFVNTLVEKKYEVLHNGREVELVARAGETPQTHALEAMMGLQVRKAHLHFLALIARLFKLRGAL